MSKQEITITITGDAAARLIDVIANNAICTPSLLQQLGKDFVIESVNVNHDAFLEALSRAHKRFSQQQE